jgi:hypothetical protein
VRFPQVREKHTFFREVLISMSIVKFSNFAAAILIGCLVNISSLTPTFAQSTDRDAVASLTMCLH